MYIFVDLVKRRVLLPLSVKFRAVEIIAVIIISLIIIIINYCYYQAKALRLKIPTNTDLKNDSDVTPFEPFPINSQPPLKRSAFPEKSC